MASLAAFLALIACISPLLTFAYLWQLKEWRLDRLREHLQAEYWLRPLFGLIRPGIVAVGVLAVFLAVLTPMQLILMQLGVLATASFVQLGTRRQPMPVWTHKALVVVVAALVIDVVIIVHNLLLGVGSPWFSIVLIIFQPVVVTIAWLLILPLDLFLKRRILNSAKQLRSEHADLVVIGITGSVGKTTTKELVAHMLQDRNAAATPAYVNSELGVSRWLMTVLNRNDKPEILVVEMGAYRLGEIQLLCDIVQPKYGIVTYIGTQHLALFGSQETLLKAKGELIDALPENGQAFLNGDNDLCRSLKGHARCPVTIVGTGGSADMEAYDIEETSTGIRFRTADTTFDVPVHGTHNVTNVLLTIAVGQALGMSAAEISSKLITFQPPEHTFTVRTEGDVTILDDTHNSSAASFRAAIAWARNQPAAHKVLVTSGLIELGEQEESTHTELGAFAAPIFERTIFTGKRGAKAFTKGYEQPIEFFGRQTAKIAPGSLLVCVGRMPPRVLRALLP